MTRTAGILAKKSASFSNFLHQTLQFEPSDERIQYFGTVESMMSDHMSIPPLIENERATPCALRNAAARCERMPWWQ